MTQEYFYGILGEIMKHYFIKAHKDLRKYNIYPGQALLLFDLNNKDGKSQKELSESLKVRPATITVMLKRMEKSGLVKREGDEKDKRISRIYISDSGRYICKEVNIIHKRFEEEILENLSVEERIILRRLLLQVRDNLRKISHDKDDINISDFF